MPEPDILDRNIHAVKEARRVAWQQLAIPCLAMFERHELRNQLKRSNSELGCYLNMMSERVRFQVRAVEDIAAGFGKPDFRLLACD
jgi:hypothetical protein